MQKDGIKKEIDSLIAKRSNHFAFLVVLGGSTIGLIFNNDSTAKLLFIVLGLLLIFVFLKGLLNIEDNIIKLIKKLKELN